MLLSIVVPVYNEIEVLPQLVAALREVLDHMDSGYEIVFVNDASTDGSEEWLRDTAANDPSIKVLMFSRNFGHQAAITTGLDFASGDAVVVMDADLQDPPSLIPEMVRYYQQGFHVVSAQRISRDGDSVFKRRTAGFFYWLMSRMVSARIKPEVGDFRLFSRSAILAIRQFREQHRFMRGLVAWLGLKEAIVPYQRPARAAGETKYPFWKMLRFAWTGISSFSALPLRLSLGFGITMTAFGFVYFLYALYAAFVERATVPGWTSLVCLQIFFSGSILMGIGVLGDYLAKIYDESKRRPLYVIKGVVNIEHADSDSIPRTIVLSDSVEELSKSRTRTFHAGG